MSLDLSSSPSSAPELAQRYLGAVLDGDEPAASALVERVLAAGWAWSRVATDVIKPALLEVGRLWERGEVSIAEEHMASEITTMVMARQARFGAPGEDRRCAVVACPGGETHVLGARAVAAALCERGWDVVFLGAATPPRALAALVAARRPSLVVLSTKLPNHIAATREAIAEVKALPDPPFVVAGGDAVAGCAEDLGADVGAVTLESALLMADRLAG